MTTRTLFDDLVQFPHIAEMTQYLIIGTVPDGKGQNDGVIRAVTTHPESVRVFGDLLGRMAREEYGVEEGARFLTELVAAATMALYGQSLYTVGDSQ